MQNQQDNTRKPLVSFIIPGYNVPEGLIAQCVQSIMALSLRTFEREIIVVDDGSATPLLVELGTLADDIVYVRQRNAGLSAARNRGLLLAQGEYIQFVDADDMLIQAPYEHCLDLVRYKQPDMVMFDFTKDGKSPTRYDDMEPMSGAHYMRNYNIRAAAWGYLFRRQPLSSLRFTDGIYHEDEEFTPQLLLRAETVYVTTAQAYFYRQHEGSIVNDRNRRKIIKRLNDKRSVIVRLHTLSATLPVTERTAMQRRVAQLTMDYIYNIIVTTRSRKYLDHRLDELRRKGLFPLPDRDYTSKYKWFRRMTNSSMGLSVLMRTLPLLKKER